MISIKKRKFILHALSFLLYGISFMLLEMKEYIGVMLAIWGNQISMCIKEIKD